MEHDNWRDRILAALERDGRKMRDVSLAAGLSHGYLHGILKDSKEPTLDRFSKICKELDLSLSYALLGLDITPDTEVILNALEGDPQRRSAVLALLGRDP